MTELPKQDINELVDNWDRGASRNARFALSGISDPTERLNVLRQFYPEAIPTDNMGYPDNFIILHDDGETSLFDESGLSWGDMTDLSALTSEVGYGILGGLAGLIGGPFAPALSVAGGVAGGEFGRQLHDERVDRILPQPRNRSILDRISDNRFDIGMEAGIGTLAEWGMNKLVPGSGTIARSVGQGVGKLIDTGIDAPPQNFKSPHGWDVEFTDDIGGIGNLGEDVMHMMVGDVDIPAQDLDEIIANNYSELTELVKKGIKEIQEVSMHDAMGATGLMPSSYVETPLPIFNDWINRIIDEGEPQAVEMAKQIKSLFKDIKIHDWWDDVSGGGHTGTQASFDSLPEATRANMKKSRLIETQWDMEGGRYHLSLRDLPHFREKIREMSDEKYVDPELGYAGKTFFDFYDKNGRFMGDILDVIDSLDQDFINNMKNLSEEIEPGSGQRVVDAWNDYQHKRVDLFEIDEWGLNHETVAGLDELGADIEGMAPDQWGQIQDIIQGNWGAENTIMKEDVGLSAPVLGDDVIEGDQIPWPEGKHELITAEDNLFKLTGGDFEITDFGDEIKDEITKINQLIQLMKQHNGPVENYKNVLDFYENVLENTKVYIWANKDKIDDPNFDPDVDYFLGTRSELIKKHGTDKNWTYGGGMAFTGEHRATLEDMARFHSIAEDLAFGEGPGRGMYGMMDTIYKITGDRTPNEYDGMTELKEYFEAYDDYYQRGLKEGTIDKDGNIIMKEDAGIPTDDVLQGQKIEKEPPIFGPTDTDAVNLSNDILALRQKQINPGEHDEYKMTPVYGNDIELIGEDVLYQISKPLKTMAEEWGEQAISDGPYAVNLELEKQLGDLDISPELLISDRVAGNLRIAKQAKEKGFNTPEIDQFIDLMDIDLSAIPERGYAKTNGEMNDLLYKGFEQQDIRNFNMMARLDNQLKQSMGITDNDMFEMPSLSKLIDDMETQIEKEKAMGKSGYELTYDQSDIDDLKKVLSKHRVKLYWDESGQMDAPELQNRNPGELTLAELNRLGLKTKKQGGTWSAPRLTADSILDEFHNPRYSGSYDDMIEIRNNLSKLDEFFKSKNSEDKFHSFGETAYYEIRDAWQTDFEVALGQTHGQINELLKRNYDFWDSIDMQNHDTYVDSGRWMADEFVHFADVNPETWTEFFRDEGAKNFSMDPTEIFHNIRMAMPPEFQESFRQSLINSMGRDETGAFDSLKLFTDYGELSNTMRETLLHHEQKKIDALDELINLIERHQFGDKNWFFGKDNNISAMQEFIPKIRNNKEFQNHLAEHLPDIKTDADINSFIAMTAERFRDDDEIQRMLVALEEELEKQFNVDSQNKIDNIGLNFDNQEMIGVMP